jgi:hypothetical protein
VPVFRVSHPQLVDENRLRPPSPYRLHVRNTIQSNSHVTPVVNLTSTPSRTYPQVVVYMPLLDRNGMEKKNRNKFAEWLGLPTIRRNAPWHSCLFETGAAILVSWSSGPHGFRGTGNDDTKDVLAEASKCNRSVIHNCPDLYRPCGPRWAVCMRVCNAVERGHFASS